MRELIGASVSTLESGGKSEAVAVVEVAEGSPAYAHGLRAGDVIVAVNRKKVRSSAELIAALKVPGGRCCRWYGGSRCSGWCCARKNERH